MNKRAFAKLCGLAALSGIVAPLDASAQSGIVIEPAQRFRLQNGLEVLLQENHLQQQVAVVVGYEIGARDDPEDLRGLAHVVEHLSYRRTRHQTRDFGGFDMLQRAGAGHIHGFTSPDYTVYQAVVPSNALGVALWVESERMAFALDGFSERTLELEREIVSREMALRLRPEVLFKRHALNEVFGATHPYYDASLGVGHIRNIELEHAQAFFQAGYRPENARLILVGAFDSAAARTLIERYFGPIKNPRRKFMRRRGALPAFADVGRVLLERPVARDELLAIWAVPGSSSRHALAVRAFARGLRDHLVRHFVERYQVVEDVDVTMLDLDLDPLLVVEMRLPVGGKGLQIEDRLAAEFAQLWTLDWSKKLARLKARLVLGAVRGQENPLTTAMAHLQEMRIRSQPFDLQQRVAAIQKLKPADIFALRSEFTRERTLIAHLMRPGPRSGVGRQGRLTVQKRNGDRVVR